MYFVYRRNLRDNDAYQAACNRWNQARIVGRIPATHRWREHQNTMGSVDEVDEVDPFAAHELPPREGRILWAIAYPAS